MPGLLGAWSLDTTHVGVSARLLQAVWVSKRGATTTAMQRALTPPVSAVVLSHAYLHAPCLPRLNGGGVVCCQHSWGLKCLLSNKALRGATCLRREGFQA